MTTIKTDNWHKYFNTGVLTLLLTVCVLILSSLHDIRKDQASIEDNVVEVETEVSLIKERQNVNINNIGSLDKRVTTLELKYVNDLKEYMEKNYVRKPQRN
jgi:hypothetical protein